MADCPVCNNPNADVRPYDYDERVKVNCPACSKFAIETDIAAKYRIDQKYPPRLSHRIRTMQRRDAREPPFVTREIAVRFAEEPLPSVREQADTLILNTGNKLRESDPAGKVDLKIPEEVAIIGAYDRDALQNIVNEISQDGEKLVNSRVNGDILSLNLTFKGWERYDEIKRKPSEAHLAFMAMPFGNGTFDRVFTEVFKPAVKDTGFELRRIDEAPRAGVIDNNLRVEIRKARFLIADPTCQNAGA